MDDTPDPAENTGVELSIDIGLRDLLRTAKGNHKAIENIDGFILTIVDSEGEAVYEFYRAIIYTFNDRFVSQLLPLKPGTYTLTQFWVVDNGNRVLYATPLAGSPLASLVAVPLPLVFTVGAGVNTTVYPEVVQLAEGQVPESFGYASFSLLPVEPLNYLVVVSVFDPVTQTLIPTTAEITIADIAGVPVYTGVLVPGSNYIPLLPTSPIYTILITKPGYEPFEVQLTAVQLEANFPSVTSTPAPVTLQPIPLNTSCADIVETDANVGDGIYLIDPDGVKGAIPPFEVYCDMTTDGGGWTLAATIANDGDNYWTWANRLVLYGGSVYGTLATALVSDFQSPAWTSVPGSQILFKADNLPTKFLRYDFVIDGTPLAVLYPPSPAIVGAYTANVVQGVWVEPCGPQLAMATQTPDLDGVNDAIGFVWAVIGEGGACDWEDSIGGINSSDPALIGLELWNRPNSFYTLNFAKALNVFVR